MPCAIAIGLHPAVFDVRDSPTLCGEVLSYRDVEVKAILLAPVAAVNRQNRAAGVFGYVVVGHVEVDELRRVIAIGLPLRWWGTGHPTTLDLPSNSEKLFADLPQLFADDRVGREVASDIAIADLAPSTAEANRPVVAARPSFVSGC